MLQSSKRAVLLRLRRPWPVQAASSAIGHRSWLSTRPLAHEEEEEEEEVHDNEPRWQQHNGGVNGDSSPLRNTPSSSATLWNNNSRSSSLLHSSPPSSLPLSSASSLPEPDHPEPRAEPETTTKTRSSSTPPTTTEPADKQKDVQTSEQQLQPDPFFLTYTGGHVVPMTSRLVLSRGRVPEPVPAVPEHLWATPHDDDTLSPPPLWPVFRLLNEDGQFRDPSLLAALDDEPSTTTRSSSDSTTDDTPPLIPVPRNDLDALRSVLMEQYPSLAEELSQSALLRPLPASYHHADDDANHESHDNTLWRLYRHMIRLRTMDDLFQSAQRQGRLSFYMTCRGEEAIHMGAASALSLQDVILAQYREQGILMHRGFTLEQFANQCFSNHADLGKGRQMPVHYGSRALNYHTVSSPLGTQLPQAVGVAYRLKLLQQNEADNNRKHVAVCFFGEGCASTTDFHSALNFAATLSAPVLFMCRNNGYAISTPVTDQYAGDGVVARAPGYGMAAIRVDGNDLFAVHAAVRQAKAYAVEHSAPVLLEFMTFRLGHHSTSDDSTRYRDPHDVKQWMNMMDPVHRMERFLQRHEWLSAQDIATVHDEERIAVLKAMEMAERKPKPPVESMFEDVYAEMPTHLKEQRAALDEHMKKFPKKYKA